MSRRAAPVPARSFAMTSVQSRVTDKYKTAPGNFGSGFIFGTQTVLSDHVAPGNLYPRYSARSRHSCFEKAVLPLPLR